MEIRVKVKVTKKKSGSGESYIVHIPKVIYNAIGRPRTITWVLTPYGLKVEVDSVGVHGDTGRE